EVEVLIRDSLAVAGFFGNLKAGVDPEVVAVGADRLAGDVAEAVEAAGGKARGVIDETVTDLIGANRDHDAFHLNDLARGKEDVSAAPVDALHRRVAHVNAKMLAFAAGGFDALGDVDGEAAALVGSTGELRPD